MPYIVLTCELKVVGAKCHYLPTKTHDSHEDASDTVFLEGILHKLINENAAFLYSIQD